MPLEKVWTSSSPKLWVKYHSPSKRVALILNNPQRFICHYTKEQSVFLFAIYIFSNPMHKFQWLFFLLCGIFFSSFSFDTYFLLIFSFNQPSLIFSFPLTLYFFFFVLIFALLLYSLFSFAPFTVETVSLVIVKFQPVFLSFFLSCRGFWLINLYSRQNFPHSRHSSLAVKIPSLHWK